MIEKQWAVFFEAGPSRGYTVQIPSKGRDDPIVTIDRFGDKLFCRIDFQRQPHLWVEFQLSAGDIEAVMLKCPICGYTTLGCEPGVCRKDVA